MASSVARRLLCQRLLRIPTKTHKVITNKCISRNICVSSARLQKFFTEKHEWIDVAEGQTSGTVGITDYAQDKLGEVVYVELPEVGTAVEFDGEAGALESVKAASDIYCPVSGEITEVNTKLTETPGLVNSSPYDEGWLFKVQLSQPSELDDLKDEEGYKAFLKEEEE